MENKEQADVRLMDLMVVEHDGFRSRSFILNFEVIDASIVNVESLKEAARRACTEYVQTEEGKKSLIIIAVVSIGPISKPTCHKIFVRSMVSE